MAAGLFVDVAEGWASEPGGNGETDDDDNAASVEGVWTRARRIASVLFGNVKFQRSGAPFLTFFLTKGVFVPGTMVSVNSLM